MSSILKPEAAAPPMPALEAANKLKRDAYHTFQLMIRSFEMGMQDFWKNPRVTPQQISNKFGADAVEIFRLHAVLATAIMTADPTTQLTDVNQLGAFTVNPDGTITITRVGPPEPEPEPEPS